LSRIPPVAPLHHLRIRWLVAQGNPLSHEQLTRDIEDMMQTIEVEPNPASDAKPRVQRTCWRAAAPKSVPPTTSRKGGGI